MSIATPRIILTVTTDLTYDQRMQRIAQALTEAGYRVILVGRERTNSLPLEARDFRQYRLSCYFQKGKLFYLEYNWKLYRYLLSQQADGICAVDLDTIVPVYLASQRKGIPRFFDAHEYFEEVPEVVNRPAVRSFWKKIAQWLVPRFDRGYTVCHSLADIFQKHYQLPFSVIRNLPMTTEFQPAATLNNLLIERIRELSTTKKIILYQGALNAGRGLEPMMDAMQEIDGAVLVLAGDGDLSSQLRAKAARDFLHKKVFFLGYVKPDTLRAITAYATLGLNLLENQGLSYYYSLANKAFDYIRAGVPALHPDFPEYQRLMNRHQTGILVERLDPYYLATLINDLLNNKPRYAVLRANCHLSKDILIWEKEVPKLLEIYNEIFGKN